MHKNKPGYYFTSESVAAGHPDKICDQISDALLDAHLELDSQARVGIECLVAPNHVVLGGEVASEHKLDTDEIENIVRKTIKRIGYVRSPFAWDDVQILNFIHRQSSDIAQGVVGKHNGIEGAGDQGIMFGFACQETEEFMPASIYYSHKLMSTLMEAKISELGPDGKCQITLEYNEAKQPVKINCLLVSIQHQPQLTQEEIKELIWPYVNSIFPEGWLDKHTHFLINPTGKFVIGGPESDVGLTGRKIIVDTYGGAAPHGGGAFSGKDPSKVDRSATYAARYLAKNIVASGIASKCLIQLAYAIGIAEPLSIYVDTFNTSPIPEDEIIRVIKGSMDLTPRGIRNHLKLDKPIYEVTASYGHFGRPPMANGAFSWEKVDLMKRFQQ